MKACILVVDDEPINVKIFTAILESDGYRAMAAISGEDCLLRVKEEPPDVILLDAMMPEMDGFETTARLKAEEATRLIPVVMVTALSDVKDRIRALDAGADDFLTKPVDKAELLARVRASLKVKEYQDEIQRRQIEKEELLNKTLKGTIRILVEMLAQTNPEKFSQCSRLVPVARRVAHFFLDDKAWQTEMALMLAPIADIAIPRAILQKIQNEEPLDQTEDSLFRIRNRQGTKLLGDIPHLTDIALSLVYRFKNYDGSGYPADFVRGGNIPMSARIVKAVLDYDKFLQQEPEEDIIAKMRQTSEKYDLSVLAVLQDVVRFISLDARTREVAIDDLIPGMILAAHVVDESGRLLIGKGNEITPLLRLRLQQMNAVGTIRGGIKVFPGNDENSGESKILLELN